MSEIAYQFGTCMDRSCSKPASVPQFSKSMGDMRKGESQPKWYCALHSGRHPNVSPVNGQPRHKQHKAYLKKEGEYVPLKRVPRIEAEGGEDGKVA